MSETKPFDKKSETPRTDAAWEECKRQGGKHEPFHGPLVECSQQLECELAAAGEIIGTLHDTCAHYEARLQSASSAGVPHPAEDNDYHGAYRTAPNAEMHNVEAQVPQQPSAASGTTTPAASAPSPSSPGWEPDSARSSTGEPEHFRSPWNACTFRHHCAAAFASSATLQTTRTDEEAFSAGWDAARAASLRAVVVPREILNAAACAVNRDRWAMSREGDEDGEKAMIELHNQLSHLLLAHFSTPDGGAKA